MASPFATWRTPILCQLRGALVILATNFISNLVSLFCQEIPRPYDKWYFIINSNKLCLGWSLGIKFLFGWVWAGSPLTHGHNHSSMTLHVTMYPKCGVNIPAESVCVINSKYEGEANGGSNVFHDSGQRLPIILVWIFHPDAKESDA